ncbi:MAG TPA: hypothetical protein DDZ66_09205 [Firmicutes bacterium]|jgi:hypothetical protein|nr:hypothetical protein [Bacillota bacterium]
MLLYYKGLVARANDIDIVIALEHVERAETVLEMLGVKQPPNLNRDYATRYFAEFVIEGIDVDVMAGFRIVAGGTTTEYVPDQKTFETFVLQDTTIHLCPLEDWYVLYLLMPHREGRVATIKEYFLENGANLTYLKAWVDRCLPKAVSDQIHELLFELNPRP